MEFFRKLLRHKLFVAACLALSLLGLAVQIKGCAAHPNASVPGPPQR